MAWVKDWMSTVSSLEGDSASQDDGGKSCTPLPLACAVAVLFKRCSFEQLGCSLSACHHASCDVFVCCPSLKLRIGKKDKRATPKQAAAPKAQDQDKQSEQEDGL